MFFLFNAFRVVIKHSNLHLSISHYDSTICNPPDTDHHACSGSRHRKKVLPFELLSVFSISILTPSKEWGFECEYKQTSSKMFHRNIYLELIRTYLCLSQACVWPLMPILFFCKFLLHRLKFLYVLSHSKNLDLMTWNLHR